MAYMLKVANHEHHVRQPKLVGNPTIQPKGEDGSRIPARHRGEICRVVQSFTIAFGNFGIA
jgi:hypothetical protein